MTPPGRDAIAAVVGRASLDRPLAGPVLVCLAGLLALSLASGGVLAGGATQVQEPEPGHFLVELQADGDATVEYTNHSNLSDDQERQWFESVRDDDAEREAVADRRRQEMQYVSDQASERVDRELRVGEVTVETETDGDVGVVTYRFEWENLAAAEDDRVVLTVPFSMYDEFDRELRVVAPDGYELTSVTPEPERRNETTASWPGLTKLTGFEVVAEGDSSDDGSGSDDGTFADGAGFGPSLGAGALLVVALLARQRRG